MLIVSSREGASVRPVGPPPSAFCPAVKLGLRHGASTPLRPVVLGAGR